MMEYGGQFAMPDGGLQMQQWYAGNLDTPVQV